MINEKIHIKLDFKNDKIIKDQEKLELEYLKVLEEHLKKSKIIQIIK